MGKLFQIRKQIDTLVAGKKDEFAIRGKIGMAAGMLIGGINESTPDDPVKIATLARAVKQILGVDV
jgi:hypothetical protein